MLNSTHIQSSCRLHSYYQRLVSVKLSGNDGLLLISSGHGTCNSYRPLSRAHIVILNELVRIFSYFVEFNKTMVLELWLHVFLQHQILLQSKAKHQTVFMPVLRNMAHSCLTSLSYTCMGNILPANFYLAGRCLLQTCKSVYQLRLSVSVDTCNTDNLPFSHIERYIFYSIILMNLGRHRQSLYIEHHICRISIILVYFQLYRTAYHHVGKLLLVCILGVYRSDVLSLSQNCNSVGDCHNFV